MAPSELPSLKRVRGALKGAVTKALTNLGDFLLTASIPELIGKKTAIERNLEKITTHDDQIAQLLDPSDLEEEVEVALEYTAQVEVSLAEISARLQDLQTSNSAVNIKLPTVQLPAFSGEVTEWTEFWDVFESAVHNKKDISAIQKLTYLKGQLSGQAKTLVEGIKVEAANYQKCVDLLKDTYGRASVIKASHVRALVNLHTPVNSLAELTEFRALFECHLRSLDNLGLTLDELFSVILMDKLPSQFKEVLMRAAGDDWLQLDTFRKLYQQELENVRATDTQITNHEQPLATASFGLRTDNRKGSPGLSCKLCQGNHIWFRCNKYGNADSKIVQIKKLNLCLVCLGSKHFARDCNLKLRPCLFCNGRHFHHLCVKAKNNKPDMSCADTEKVKSTHAITYAQKETKGSGEAQVDNSKNSSWSKTTCVLSTVNVPLLGNSKESVNSRAFLDQGSQVSFIRRDLLKKVMHIKLGHETLKLRTYHFLEKDKVYEIVKVFFKYKGKESTIECFVDDSLPGPHNYQGLQQHISKFKAQGIRLADDYLNCSKTFDLLIGLDNYYNIVHPGFRRQRDLILLPTKFGYALSGKFARQSSVKQTHTVSVLKVATSFCDNVEFVEKVDQTIKSDLTSLWELDHIGINHDEMDIDSCSALEHFHKNIEYSDCEQQYMVRLPWKASADCLPDNFGLALGRLKGLQKKFIANPSFCHTYSKIIQEQEKRGFVEKIHPEKSNGPCHYLSHHGVLKDSITTPIRTVFDCSAKVNNNTPSLNDLLYTGPSLVSHLCHILLRLRLHRYVTVSDIEKAFLMIKLHPKDRDVTRFLWFEDPSNPHSKLVTYRFTVVLFGATCSQFLLNATILYHLSTLEKSDFLKRGLYIDNLILTSDTEEQLVTRYWTAQQVFTSAHLFLREWVTNSDILLDQITIDQTRAESQSMVKILGMRWWPSMDELGFQPCFQDLTVDVDRPTKRILLSIVARLFDPLGVLLPVTIRSRILLQEVWRRRINWDDRIPEDLLEIWINLFQDLKLVLSTTIPRQILPTGITKCDIHVFADASKVAFGSVIYSVFGNDSRLVMSKARVAPIKGLTIPKMELTAVLIAARLFVFVKEAFSPDIVIDRCVIWSDSQIVLHWLYNTHSILPVYIRNRVDDIRTLIPNAEYKYVPTQDNPADLLTRGLSAVVLSDSELWWRGPSWLPSTALWPQWGIKSEGFLAPVGSNNVFMTDVLIQQASVAASRPVEVIDWSRYSTFEKMNRVLAWVMRFTSILRRTITGNVSSAYSYLTVKELKTAEINIIRLIQSESFTHELNFLRDGKDKGPNLVRQLNLFYSPEDGLLRCRGRLKFADLHDNMKYPILLPRNHRVTRLLIERAHRCGMHYGVNYVVTVLRQSWWIPRMRQTVKAVVGKCVVCQRWRSKAFPPMAPPDLPEFRVNCTAPFAITGVDYTGAVNIKSRTDLQTSCKVYIVLFTCAVTRAIHIEIAEDLSSLTFLRVFRRFCGRRSFPKLMLSDNATYFTAAAKYLRDLMTQEDVVNFLHGSGCEWRFIPARAPWFGSIWERCIGIVKAGINRVLGRAFVTYDELHTVLVELEATVNDRPLTYPSGDLEDPEALTPSHLLNGRRLRPYPLLTEIPDLNDPDFQMSQQRDADLRERYQHVSKVSSDLWRRWTSEYLTSLRVISQISVNQDPWPAIGEVVLLGDDGSRLHWKLGIVTKLYHGNDQKVRVVQLKTSNGFTIRPVVKLYPMELRAEIRLSNRPDQPDASDGAEALDTASQDGAVNKKEPIMDSGRPVRLTARGAQQMWRDRLNAGQL